MLDANVVCSILYVFTVNKQLVYSKIFIIPLLFYKRGIKKLLKTKNPTKKITIYKEYCTVCLIFFCNCTTLEIKVKYYLKVINHG